MSFQLHVLHIEYINKDKLHSTYTKTFRNVLYQNQIVTTEKEANFKCKKAIKNMLVYIEFFNHHIQSDHGALFETVF